MLSEIDNHNLWLIDVSYQVILCFIADVKIVTGYYFEGTAVLIQKESGTKYFLALLEVVEETRNKI